MTLYLVINIHGTINSSAPVRSALGELWVSRKFSATVVGDDAATVGMLRLCKDYVAWAPVQEGLLSDLLEKRGMVSKEKPLDKDSLKALGVKSHKELAAKMMKDQSRLSAVSGVLPYFRLAPPRGGFKRSMRRQSTEKGVLGSNPDLEGLVRRMF